MSKTALHQHANFSLSIEPKASGQSIDAYLSAFFPYQQRSMWASADFRIDGQAVALSSVLSPLQQLEFSIGDYQEDPVDTRWRLLWEGEGEGEGIIAVHKPAGLPVSRTTRNIYNTLIGLVQRESPWPDAHLLHRLDLETSGIILLGKDKAAAERWQSQLATLMQRKIYRAVVYGQPNWQEQSLQCHLGKLKESPIRCLMHVFDKEQVPEGCKAKHSRTDFKLLSTSGDYSLIECELFTGRQHQIRAHLAHLGHPIVGDKIYAHEGEYYLKRLQDQTTEKDDAKLQTPHHLLCAYRVELNVDGHTETLVDDGYPQAWLDFAAKQGLEG